MVLVPIGESAVTININGTQRVDELIKDDTTYNLSESFNTQVYVNGSQRVNTKQNSDDTYNITESLGSTIKVNGSTEGSFTQTSDSTYNVSTAPNISDAGNLYEYENNLSTTIVDIRSPLYIEKIEYSISSSTTNPSGTGGGEISVAGNTEVDVGYYETTSSSSGTITNFAAGSQPTGAVVVKTTDEGDVDYDVTVYFGGFDLGTTVSRL
jgi:hypothetical protein